MRELFLPILRAGVGLLETYEYMKSAPLDCPVTVFGRDRDLAISRVMWAGWQECTAVGFAQHEFAGGYFFIHAERGAVVSVVAESLV